MSDIQALLRDAAATIEDLQPLDLAIVDELRAAAEKMAEPVAWLVEHDDYPTAVELPDETHRPETIEKQEAMGWRLTPLYAAPQAPAVPGLSDADIIRIASDPLTCPCNPYWLKDEVRAGDVRKQVLAFARAILTAAGDSRDG